MLYSRHVWTLGIAILCLFGLILWESPQAVWSTLVDPQYSSSPRTSVQKYWDLLDSRQLDLARELLVEDGEGSLPVEFGSWKKSLQDDPFLVIQRVEFLETDDPQNLVVRVTWNTLADVADQAIYSFQVISTEQGWRIRQIRRVEDVPTTGGRGDGQLLGSG